MRLWDSFEHGEITDYVSRVISVSQLVGWIILWLQKLQICKAMIFDVRTQASDKDTDMRGGLQTSAKPIAFIIFTFDRLE